MRRAARSPPPEQALESKGTTRPWALQPHYNHAGWYIVWRYLVDPTKMIKTGTNVIIWRVDVALLKQEDWKYAGSKAAEGRVRPNSCFRCQAPRRALRQRRRLSASQNHLAPKQTRTGEWSGLKTAAAVSSGFYKSEYFPELYPRLQILTVEELLDGKQLHFARHRVETFKKADHQSKDAASQSDLF